MSIQLPNRIPMTSRWQRQEASQADSSPIGTAPPPLSDAELIKDFERWGTPRAGQSYVFDARQNSPSRKVGSRVGNVVTHYTSRKMQRRLATESRKPEFAAVIRYDFDGVTREIYCQPPQVRISVPTERKAKGGVTTYMAPVPYTPDILRITPYGIYVDEWKTQKDLEKLVRDFPRRFYQDDDGTWRCPEREKFFAELGITFCLRSGDENGTVFVSNLEFLDDYLTNKCSPLSDTAWEVIQKIASKSCPMSLSELLKDAFPETTPWNEPLLLETPPGAFLVDDVFKAIADRRLFVDLEFDDLSEPHDVILCSSFAQLDELKVSRPVPKAVNDEFTFDVDIGTEFMFTARSAIFQVSAVTEEAVHYFDQQSKDATLMPISAFEKLLFNRDITLLATAVSTDELLSRISGLNDEQIIQGKNRFLMVRDIEMGRPVCCSMSKRQVQRLRAAARAAGDSHIAQRRALTPKRRSGGRCQVTNQQLDLMREAIEAGNNATNPGTRASYKLYKELSAEAGAPLVSRKTFQQRKCKFADKKAREGARVAYNEEPATWYLQLTDKVHGGRPFHRMHIDHTKLDVFVKIRTKGGRIRRRRPWLTLAMDAETRAILGFYLSIHAPSTTSCMMVIRHMVQKYRRTPSVIVVDNGKEFHSDAFDKLCDMLYISLQFRPAHQSRFGSVIERFFGTTNTDLLHNLIGNTKALRNVRTVTRSVDPLRADLMNFAQLHGLLDEYFFRDYNMRIHPAHDHAPIEYMNLRFGCTGRRLSRLTPYDADFYILTCIPPKGSTRILNKQRGVKIDHIWYWSEAFADKSLRDKQELPTLIDMWDVSTVYVLLNGDWIRCQSALLMKYRKLTAIEWRYVIYELRLRMKRLPDEGLEPVLCSVLSDHLLPDDASLTAATRQVYGEAGLVRDDFAEVRIDVTDDAIVIPATQDVLEPSESNLRKPLLRLPTQLKLNYDELPTSRPI